jgi:hypothetical protein
VALQAILDWKGRKMSDEYKRMRQLIGPTAEWAAHDIVIGKGEVAVEQLTTGAAKIKIGDGVLRYSQLPFIDGGLDLVALNAELAKYVKKAGDTLAGALNLPVGEPTGNSAVSRVEGDKLYVKKAGDTMTGLLTLSGAPTSDLHAATKKYADSLIPKATGASQILVSDSTTGFPWQVGDLDEGRY